jgi:Amt family ammonium transporter
VAGVVVPLGVDLLEHLRIDDPIGAVAVHGFAGIWGTLSLGLFATGAYGVPTPDGVDTSATVKGLLYGGGIEQLKAQAIGSLTCVVVISAVSILLFYLVDMTRTLRVSAEGELEGLDVHEHGTHAYHMEFGQGSSFTAFPSGGTKVSNGVREPVPSEKEPAAS